ncbi:MAG: hypothetical protein ACD_45C00679G0002 [uncultured bacterium]|nr:MAG: hypothetical protein ACD_45C00679G0002 [uncultured bacterium]
MKMTRLISFLCISFGIFILAGCQNTMEGFGKDMQHAGQEIQKSAN